MSNKCKKCGKCCSNFLPLCDEDIKKIKNNIQQKKLKENKKVYLEQWHDICPFLNSQNLCDIYVDRPIICQHFTCDWHFSVKFINEVATRNFKLTDLREKFFR